ncbi:MAG: hypothetical protein U5R31_06990 [Acidimicrobiia bacterium]|nr:hypothetical protein [Acidimicrobiia bacterium]
MLGGLLAEHLALPTHERQETTDAPQSAAKVVGDHTIDLPPNRLGLGAAGPADLGSPASAQDQPSALRVGRAHGESHGDRQPVVATGADHEVGGGGPEPVREDRPALGRQPGLERSALHGPDVGAQQLRERRRRLLHGPRGVDAGQRHRQRVDIDGATHAGSDGVGDDSACSIGSTGSVNQKVDPSPSTESTQILPPCWAMVRAQMASPRPVPVSSRGPSRRNSSKIRTW